MPYVSADTGVIGCEVVCAAPQGGGEPGYDGELCEFCVSWQFPPEEGEEVETVTICVPVYGKNYYKSGTDEDKAEAHAKNQVEADMPPGDHILGDPATGTEARGDNNAEVAARLVEAIENLDEDQSGEASVKTKDVTKRGRKGLQTKYYLRVLIPGAMNVDASCVGDQPSKLSTRGYAPGTKGYGVGIAPPWKAPIPFDDDWRRNTPWRGPPGQRSGKGTPNRCKDAMSESKIRHAADDHDPDVPTPEDGIYLEPEGENGWESAK